MVPPAWAWALVQMNGEATAAVLRPLMSAVSAAGTMSGRIPDQRVGANVPWNVIGT